MSQFRPFLDETLGNVIPVEPLFDLPMQVFDRLRRFAVIIVNDPRDPPSVFPTLDQPAQCGNFHTIGRSIVVPLHTVFGDMHDLKIDDLVLEAINQYDDAFLCIATMTPGAIERTNRLWEHFLPVVFADVSAQVFQYREEFSLRPVEAGFGRRQQAHPEEDICDLLISSTSREDGEHEAPGIETQRAVGVEPAGTCLLKAVTDLGSLIERASSHLPVQ
jgi:hypothetical protein